MRALTSLRMVDAPRYVVTLGDERLMDAAGPGLGAASLLFKNNDDRFPEFIGNDLSTRLPGARLVPLTTVGAQSRMVTLAQLPRLSEMAIVPEIVIVSVGLDDFSATWGDPETISADLVRFSANLGAIATQLRNAAPDAKIVWTTAFDPLDGIPGVAPTTSTIAFARSPGSISLYNQRIRTIASRFGIVVADLFAAFRGHGLAAGDIAGENPTPENPELYLHRGLSPTLSGASAIRAALLNTLFP